MEVFDLKNKQEYLYEVMELEYLEWANDVTSDKENRINKKIYKYLEYVNRRG